ncbi:MAG: CDP-alcohol phosphatidyltransferase family protein [Candidatus Marinimicrobia bacterium]|nr:CDP-alcohol phosphatidyltransferase family protein [Candidatus Neomarinimicrobiota bacterium]
MKLIYRFPVTPNQVSFLSMLTGIISGIFYTKGNVASFVYAGLLYGFAHVLDCCDGMVARFKKSGTHTGRIIDGLADYVNSTAVFIGLGIGLSKSGLEFPVSPWLLVIFSAMFTALHCIIVDYYRNEFLAHAFGKVNSVQEDMELFSMELKKLKQVKGKYFEKLLIKLYLLYSDIQVFKGSEKRKYDQEKYYRSNKMLLYSWLLIGPTAHISVLVISTILYKPVIFFYYVLIAANILMLLIWVIQVQINKKICLEY